jgi:hypothetical protein
MNSPDLSASISAVFAQLLQGHGLSQSKINSGNGSFPAEFSEILSEIQVAPELLQQLQSEMPDLGLGELRAVLVSGATAVSDGNALPLPAEIADQLISVLVQKGALPGGEAIGSELSPVPEDLLPEAGLVDGGTGLIPENPLLPMLQQGAMTADATPEEAALPQPSGIAGALRDLLSRGTQGGDAAGHTRAVSAAMRLPAAAAESAQGVGVRGVEIQPEIQAVTDSQAQKMAGLPGNPVLTELSHQKFEALMKTPVAINEMAGQPGNGLAGSPVSAPSILHQAIQRMDAQVATEIPVPLSGKGWDSAVSEKILWMVGRQIQGASLKISPRHLGPIEIQVLQQNDQTSVTFTANNAAVKEALEAAIPRLREMFNDSNLQLANVNVEHRQPGEQQSASRFAQNSQGHGGNQSDGAEAGSDPGIDQEDMVPMQGGALGRGLVDAYA